MSHYYCSRRIIIRVPSPHPLPNTFHSRPYSPSLTTANSHCHSSLLKPRLFPRQNGNDNDKRRTRGYATKARHCRRRGMGEALTSGAQSRWYAACDARGNFSDSRFSECFAPTLTLTLATPSLHLAVHTTAAWKPSRSDRGSGRRGRC